MQRELIIGSFQYLKSSCPRYESWVPLTSPLLWSYSFLTQVCNPSQINFLVWCGVGNEVNFCSISSYSSVIYEKAFPFFFFFHWIVLVPVWKSMTMYVGVYFWILCCAPLMSFSLSSIPCHLDYSSLYGESWNQVLIALTMLYPVDFYIHF